MIVLTGSAGSLAAYEFEIDARTIGQGYTLRSLRFSVADLALSRRRFTQTLSLDIWDIGRVRDRRQHRMDRTSGPRISFTSYLRIDHDFGTWSTGSVFVNSQLHDAVDLVPELEASLLALDVLYAYVAAEDLASGLIDLHVGRQLDVDTLDWWSMDGVRVRVSPALPVAFEAFGGLRVRDASPLGSAGHEPDGTGSGQCAEYVEGPVPGSGAWRPIDRQVLIENDPFASDYDVCPQRHEIMPTFGGSVETSGLDRIWARLTYRRSMSQTPGLIGDVDRFEYPDTGLYPNENGQAPAWGVNEELLAASMRTHHDLAGGRGQITPYAALRYNGLVATVDEGHLGMRLRYGAHSVEPELYYSFPTFDGDSIFNVFAIEPYVDTRITYDVRPAASRLSAYGRAWLRHFQTQDEPAQGSDIASRAAGVQLGAQYREERRASLRLDAFCEGGYGGTRVGTHAAAAWQPSRRTGLRTRLSVIHFDQDLREEVRGTTYGVQAGATYEVNDGVTLHLMAEENTTRFESGQFRLMGIIDLAFLPEV